MNNTTSNRNKMKTKPKPKPKPRRKPSPNVYEKRRQPELIPQDFSALAQSTENGNGSKDRPYQGVAIAETLEALKQHDNVLLVSPTGAGKTYMFGRLWEELGRPKTLFLAHTKKLVRQVADSIANHQGSEVEIEMANQHADPDAQFISSSMQSMNNRIKKGRFPRGHFELLCIDEAHRANGPTYRKIINYFKHDKLVGLTATPRRGDKQDIMKPHGVFDVIGSDLKMDSLIDDGYLSRLKIVNMPIQIDVSGVKMTRGDYDERALGHAITPYLDSIAKELSKFKGRRMLVFCPLRDVSRMFCEACEKHGLYMQHVDGETPVDQQELFLKQLKRKEIDGLSNAMLLTEGVDIPPVDLLMCLRLTTSWTLYVQMMGRGTRLSPETGKEDCIILDPLWLCDDHSLLQRPENLIAETEEEAKGIREMLGEEGDLLQAREDMFEQRTRRMRERLQEMKERKKRSVDAMQLFAAAGNRAFLDYEPISPVENRPVSEKQKQRLVSNKIIIEPDWRWGHANMILNEIYERAGRGECTPRMALTASKFGHEDPWAAPFEEINQFLNEKFK